MMNLDFFKKIRILDGGMGQELLTRGMKPNGTLWSANAVLNPDYHKLLLDTHLDFVKLRADTSIEKTVLSKSIPNVDKMMPSVEIEKYEGENR